ncbi:MAG: flagellar motor switch protein FliG [Bryobacteraceae bacterium]
MKLHDRNQDRGLPKAAALLATLGEEASAKIIRNLNEGEVQRVSQAIAQLSQLSSEDAQEVVEEFHQMLLAQQYVVKGGMDYAQGMLSNAFGPETAARLIDRVRAVIAAELANLDVLQKADPQQLAKFIHSEHPQTIALILSQLNSTQAAALLSSLPQELRSDVAVRMAHLDQISPDIINKIAGVIEQKLKALGEFNRESCGGVRAVAEMINRLDTNASKELLSSIEADDMPLFETIRHLMFVFEDLMQVDIRDLKELIQKVDRKILTIALKGTSDQLKSRIMSVMSQRSADMLREDIEVVGAVKIREVEAAQTQVIAIIREMEKEGTITLMQSDMSCKILASQQAEQLSAALWPQWSRAISQRRPLGRATNSAACCPAPGSNRRTRVESSTRFARRPKQDFGKARRRGATRRHQNCSRYWIACRVALRTWRGCGRSCDGKPSATWLHSPSLSPGGSCIARYRWTQRQFRA